MDVRYFDEESGLSEFALYVNGALQGTAWEASASNAAWATQTIPDVRIIAGDEIAVGVEGGNTGQGKLDYLQLNHKAP